MKRYIRATTNLEDFEIDDDGVLDAYHGSDEYVVIPDGVIEIGYRSFANLPYLKSVVIPDSVREIGQGAFSDCPRLTDVVIPNSVKRIKDFAFGRCRNLTNAAVPSSASVEPGAFESTPMESLFERRDPIARAKTKLTVLRPEGIEELSAKYGWIAVAWKKAADLHPDGELGNATEFAHEVWHQYQEGIGDWLSDAGYELPEGEDVHQWVEYTDIYNMILDKAIYHLSN